MKKKLFAAISLGILSTFVSGVLTASAAELIVKGGPDSMTAEQKAEWVGKYSDNEICHISSLENNRIELSGDFAKFSVCGASKIVENKNVANNIVIISNAKTGEIVIGGYSEYGNAYNNIVVLTDVVMSDGKSIKGGDTTNGIANGNSVTIDGFSGGIDIVIGGAAYQGASNNIVNIKNVGNAAVEIQSLDITAFGSIMGGEGKDAVANNEVIISGNNGFYTRDIYGGNAWGLAPDESIKSVVTGNVVSISGSGKIVSHNIYGGFIDKGNAENNQVNISGNVKLEGLKLDGVNNPLNIYGGYTENGEANNNIVRFDGVKFTADRYEICGGYSKLGNVSGNTIVIDKSNRAYDEDNEMMWIAGGETEAGNAVNNQIIITDSSLYGSGYTTTQNALMGGYSHKGDALSNSIEVSGSHLKGYLEGGRAFAGNALENYVVVDGGSLVGATVYGAAVDTGNGRVEDNGVSIQNAYVDVSEIIGGNGNSDSYNQHVGELSKNVVEIVNSSFNGMVCGAMGEGSSKLVGNKVMIEESNNISQENDKNYNANVDIYGGRSLSDALVQGNTVKIISSELRLEKGVAESENRIFGGCGKGVIKENIVTVYDSTFEGQLIGGRCEVNEFASVVGNIVGIKDSTIVGDIIAAQNKAGMAVDNRILLTGGKTDVSQANLIGATNAEKGKGNTLSLMDWSGKALSVAGFDAYEFIYNKTKDITKPMLSVGSVNDIDNGTEFSMYFDESVKLSNGQKLELIASDTAFDAVINKQQQADIGVALEADGTLKSDGNNINFEISAIRANHQTDIVGIANVAAVSFVADGAQLAVDGMEQLNRDEYGFNTFASAYGSNGDYDNGVDMNGWNTMVGVGHNAETESGAFAWGVFYETGSGEMKAENSYRKAVFGVDGKAVYNGYGAAARLSKDNGVYYEAGLRAGKLKNNLSNALMNADLAAEGYKTESDYLGYHVGVGKAVALDNGDQFDVYARYYHTQVDGDSFVASGGERYDLDKVYSDRIRVGGRYSDELNEAVKVYYGAAYEYEFSGEAEGSVKGYAMDKSDLGGSTFVGELGLLMNNPGSAWTVDMSLQAYACQYDGIGGKVQATYHF